MKSKTPLLFILFLSASIFSFAAQPIRKCIICHQKPDVKKILPSGIEKSVYVDRKILKGSVHKSLKCQDCHVDVTVIPHQGLRIGKVNCSRCHFNGNNQGVKDSPMYQQFWNSVHGQKLLAHDPKAPNCQDCHGTHNIYPAKSEKSMVHKKHIPDTCGKCHLQVYEIYADSVHGKAILEKGVMDVPVCTDCHGKHDVYSSDMSVSKVNSKNIPDTCSACHANYTMMKQLNLSTEQVDTFKHSFHGVALKFGEKAVANCSSCHGTHSIKKQSDPESSINPKNLPKTCGKCHEGANENFAKGKMHLDPFKKESGLIYYVAQAFIWLTTLTMLGLFAHILLDLKARLKEKKEHKESGK